MAERFWEPSQAEYMYLELGQPKPDYRAALGRLVFAVENLSAEPDDQTLAYSQTLRELTGLLNRTQKRELVMRALQDPEGSITSQEPLALAILAELPEDYYRSILSPQVFTVMTSIELEMNRKLTEQAKLAENEDAGQLELEFPELPDQGEEEVDIMAGLREKADEISELANAEATEAAKKISGAPEKIYSKYEEFRELIVADLVKASELVRSLKSQEIYRSMALELQQILENEILNAARKCETPELFGNLLDQCGANAALRKSAVILKNVDIFNRALAMAEAGDVGEAIRYVNRNALYHSRNKMLEHLSNFRQQ